MTDPNEWSSPDDRSDRPADRPQDVPVQQLPPPDRGQRHAPKPGVVPLRPLGIPEILDGSITAIRSYPRQMLGLSVVVATIANVLSNLSLYLMVTQTDIVHFNLPNNYTQLDLQLEQLRITLLVNLPRMGITMLAGMFLGGLLTIVVGKAVLGQHITIGEAWRHVRARIGVLFVLSVLYTAMVAVGTVVFVIPAVWLYVLFSLASTALILEGAKLGRAFARSRDLVSDAWFRTFGILLLATIVAGIVGQVLSLPFEWLSGGLNTIIGTGPNPSYEVALVLTTVGGIIADTITLPFVSGVTTLVYLDRRMRREAMDIELTRQAAGPAGRPPAPEPAAAAW